MKTLCTQTPIDVTCTCNADYIGNPFNNITGCNKINASEIDLRTIGGLIVFPLQYSSNLSNITSMSYQTGRNDGVNFVEGLFINSSSDGYVEGKLNFKSFM